MKKLIRILCAGLAMVFFFSMSVPSASAAGAANLTEGCYAFTSGLSSSKCLDVSGAGIDNGTNIQIWTSNNTGAQLFYITKVNSGWYSIRNIDSRKAIDVAGGIRGSGVNVQLYDWNGTDAQLWKFYNAGNGYYYIKNKLGYYLDVSGGSTSDGTNVQVYQSNGTKSQMWKLDPSQGVYTLTSGLSNSKCLDVNDAGTANGTNIQIWSRNNTVAQMFYITKVNSEWYSIQNIASKKAIDVAGGVKGSGVNVQLYDWNGTDAQLWKFYDAGNGYYYIKNKLGYYLDVRGGSTSDGTNVHVYQSNGTSAQMWKLELTNLTQKINEHVIVNLYEDGIIYLNKGWEKLLYYYQYFNHGAKYDVKSENCWNNLFVDIAYPGFYGVILYDGLVITPEQMGNIIYGFVGNALGFSDRIIYQGGGYAASGTTYLHDASKYYGDSAMDHEFISIGISMLGKTPTIDFDLSEVPSWVLDLAKNIL